ncbi:hypothetical protein [Chryseobacterium sp. StRB126]|uniref:hypothetical protein n=1 Tax=Chryseobacterium sp. StRB126 TaxID=878220 RepID=UPI0005EDC937|nr:hypothetical protein [Chryseobacterium sp. StRB126]
MRKNIIKPFIFNIILLSVLVYVLGLTDSAFQQVYPSHTILSYGINSLKYFLFWVLPYWWFIIIVGAVVLTFLYVVFRKIRSDF